MLNIDTRTADKKRPIPLFVEQSQFEQFTPTPLVNKNAIKPKIGGPPREFFLKALTPLGILAKNIRYHLPWIFNLCASMLNHCNHFYRSNVALNVFYFVHSFL
jgi:hypothetical protein